jgi:hypothetical protein
MGLEDARPWGGSAGLYFKTVAPTRETEVRVAVSLGDTPSQS